MNDAVLHLLASQWYVEILDIRLESESVSSIRASCQRALAVGSQVKSRLLQSFSLSLSPQSVVLVKILTLTTSQNMYHWFPPYIPISCPIHISVIFLKYCLTILQQVHNGPALYGEGGHSVDSFPYVMLCITHIDYKRGLCLSWGLAASTSCERPSRIASCHFIAFVCLFVCLLLMMVVVIPMFVYCGSLSLHGYTGLFYNFGRKEEDAML